MKKSQNNQRRAGKPAFFTRYMQEKLLIFVIAVFVILIALLARLYIVQRDNSEEYSRIVLSQRQTKYSSRTLRARRGDIYDRNGSRLATSIKIYTLILNPAQMLEKENRNEETGQTSYDVTEPTVSALCEQFGFDREELTRTLKEQPDRKYIRYQKGISYEDKKAFEDYAAGKNREYAASENKEERKKTIMGVSFEDEYQRQYPNDSLACNVIGFVMGDGTDGIGGVEQYYNEELSGTDGREYGYLNDDSNLERVVRNATDGNTLILTIDSTIQSITEKYLDEWKNGEIGSKSAACIVMDPNNGEILAMAGTGRFDLNDPRTTEGYTDQELLELGKKEAVRVWKRDNPEEEPISPEETTSHFSSAELMSYGSQAAWNNNWKNPCISNTYEPGSVQKVFTVAGALEESLVNMNEEFLCEGHKELTDGVNTWKIGCVNRNGHGVLNVTQGITQSCNCVMMDIAFREKNELFMKYQRLFGLGESTGIDLPAEENCRTLGFATDEIGRTRLATNSFGQNYNCTMIQMAAGFCSVINGGRYYEPHVVKKIQTQEGVLVEEKKALLVRQTVSEQTSRVLRDTLFETVEHGTGAAAAVEGYQVGGKTGTAEKQPRSAQKYVVSFCGFAPVNDPKLVCYVIVDEPNLPGEEAAHSSFASAIFSKIMAEALPVVGVFPAGTAAMNYRAPNAQGENPEDIQNAEPEASGELQNAQSQASGELQNVQGEAAEETLAETGAVLDNIQETAAEPAETDAPLEPETDEFVRGDGESYDLPEMLDIGSMPM